MCKNKLKLKKGDTIIVLAGKDKGKKGKIIRSIPDKEKVVVEGINIAKRHQKPTQKFPGGIIEKAIPMHISKVMLVCPRCGKPAKIALKQAGAIRQRACKKCGEIVDKV